MADILQLESGDNLLLEDGVSNLELEAAGGGGGGDSVIPVIVRYLKGQHVGFIIAWLIWHLTQLRN